MHAPNHLNTAPLDTDHWAEEYRKRGIPDPYDDPAAQALCLSNVLADLSRSEHRGPIVDIHFLTQAPGDAPPNPTPTRPCYTQTVPARKGAQS